MTPWLIVPTLGNRDASLLPLLDGAGMPAVVVCTGPASPNHYRRGTGPQSAAGRVHAFSAGGSVDRNSQRWWNDGIDYAVDRGADRAGAWR